MLDIDRSKSYATRKNLEDALIKVGLDKCRPIIVRNTKGRWTAIFGAALSGNHPAYIAHRGFMVIN